MADATCFVGAAQGKPGGNPWNSECPSCGPGATLWALGRSGSGVMAVDRSRRGDRHASRCTSDPAPNHSIVYSTGTPGLIASRVKSAAGAHVAAGALGVQHWENRRGGVMNHETALSKATEIAASVLAPAARQNDKEGRFSSEAVDALGRAGLLGLMLPAELGGSGLGPRSFAAVTAALAEADASVAMVYLMHICAVATIAAAPPGAAVEPILRE